MSAPPHWMIRSIEIDQAADRRMFLDRQNLADHETVRVHLQDRDDPAIESDAGICQDRRTGRQRRPFCTSEPLIHRDLVGT